MLKYEFYAILLEPYLWVYRRKKEEQKKKKDQAKILGKHNSRTKLSFKLG